MAEKDGLAIEQAFLDTYFGLESGLEDFDPEFVSLFEAPKDEDKDGLMRGRPKSLREDLVAKDAAKIIDFIVAKVGQESGLRHTRKRLNPLAAGVRILESDQWPFPVAHVWLQLELVRDDKEKPPDIYGYFIAAAQDVFYALCDSAGAGPKKALVNRSAAIFSILATAEPSLFTRLRSSWIAAAQPEARERKDDVSDLWSSLPPNWQVGEPWGASHMAQGINIHAIIGTMHGLSDSVRQAYSITIQDAKRKSYTDRPVPAGSGGWIIGEESFLSSHRAAYYYPRSQELGMLMLLDQWTHERIRSMRPLEQEVFDRLGRTHRPDASRAFPSRYFQASARKIGKLRIRVGKERAILRRAITGATSRLRHVAAGGSARSGIEVPAYQYPATGYGRQEVTHESLIQTLAERALLRIEGLSETMSTLMTVMGEEIMTRNSVRQTALTVVMAVMTLVIMAATVVLVLRV